MLRRFVIALSVVSLVGAMSITQAGATAGVVHSKRVCGISYSSKVAQCFARVVTDAKGRPLHASPNVSGYGPSQFHTGYNLPTSVIGKHTIAIVDAFNQPNILSDLNVYNAQFGLPAMKKCKLAKQTNCLAILNQNGQTSPLPRNDSGWGLEISLDVEIARAICQNCRINLYEANTNSFANLETAVNTAAATRRVVAISNSYGAFGSDCSTQSAYNHPRKAVTVSTGDKGFGIACPANQNTVVAVGGTHLNLNGSGGYVSESAWGGGGSACSTVINAMSFQTTATNWAAIGCGTKRGMADVSADADPATGAAVFDSFGAGGWNVVGGTSLSSPLIAGVYALANNVANWNYPAQSAYASPGSLHDVTTGSNGSCGGHPLQCNAGAGYDLPTGIGTPNGLGGF
jgi:subtilase family serine protease